MPQGLSHLDWQPRMLAWPCGASTACSCRTQYEPVIDGNVKLARIRILTSIPIL